MKHTITLKEHFGPFLADGSLATNLRVGEIETHISEGAIVVLDFDGITGMSDSFANALVGNLYIHLNGELKGKVVFTNCSERVKGHLLDSLAFARKRMQAKQAV